MTDTKDALGPTVSRRRFLSIAALAGVGVAGGSSLLAGCGAGSAGGPGGAAGGGGGGQTGGGAVTWGSWANPGEAERFKQYSKDYEQKTGVKVTYQTVVGDYQSKLLTQLAGGTAPDAFYVGDSSMAKLIESGKLEDLTSYLNSPEAAVKADSTYPGLIQWCKAESGGLYGIPVDCNPKVFWFNKGLLEQAGVTTNPAAAYEGGTWNQAALDELLNKVKGTGKRGMVVEGNWFDFSSIITTFGGTAFDESTGKAVFDQDPKAQEILAWLFKHFEAETITYGGSLPKGQGVDALFYGGQLASITYGRWILPNLKKLKNLQYDIAPMPSDTGNEIKPVAVYTAAMSVNTGAKQKDVALTFMGNFVNADGQRARLSGGGNAVPSTAGLDDVVTEGNLPEHGAWFTEVASKGYAIPLVIARNAEVATNLSTEIDKVIKGGASSEEFAKQIAAFINGGS
jgi:multiple sugar transport system substrate-binding protein